MKLRLEKLLWTLLVLSLKLAIVAVETALTIATGLFAPVAVLWWISGGEPWKFWEDCVIHPVLDRRPMSVWRDRVDRLESATATDRRSD